MPYEIPMNFLNNNGSKSARLSTSGYWGLLLYMRRRCGD